MKCRFCKNNLSNKILDLGSSPPSNSYLSSLQLTNEEKKFPLKLFLCENCFLVQTEDFNKPEELFTNDYAYFSSTSALFLKHAKEYVEKITKKIKLNNKSFVVEIASNDGYLLRNFLNLQIPCLGIEPTKSTFLKSIELKIPTINKFFNSTLSVELTSNHNKADLIIANNVYAHVPDINDFTLGIKRLLKNDGTVTLEFPHLLNLIKQNLFDTVYHEHYSYLSLSTVGKIFDKLDLKVYDVEKIPTHGGSLRIYGCHKNDDKAEEPSVQNIYNEEKDFGLLNSKQYSNLQIASEKVKTELIEFLQEKKKQNKVVVGYGAAAKGNTLLNYCGINKNLIKFVCDAAKSKQNKFLPGSHIEIKKPEDLYKNKIDYILILPWNIKDEIMNQHNSLNDKGVVFFTAINGIKFL